MSWHSSDTERMKTPHGQGLGPPTSPTRSYQPNAAASLRRTGFTDVRRDAHRTAETMDPEAFGGYMPALSAKTSTASTIAEVRDAVAPTT